jgi:hypothetical protein
MSERKRLTVRSVEELQPRPSRYIAWDPANAGFGVRVSPKGVKSFVYAYRFNGVSRLLTIGSAPPLTLEQARVWLAQAQAKVIRRAFNADGTLKELGRLDDAMAAVASVKVRELFGEGKDGKGEIGQTVEIRLWDKNSAIDRLMKHLGAYERDNAQRNGPQAWTDAELMERLTGAFERLGVQMPKGLTLLGGG